MADGIWFIVHGPFAISAQPLAIDALSPVLDVFCFFRHGLQLGGLAPVQTLRDGERRVHAHDAGVEIELGYALETAGRAFLDAHPAAFAVVHENLVEAVRA